LRAPPPPRRRFYSAPQSRFKEARPRGVAGRRFAITAGLLARIAPGAVREGSERTPEPSDPTPETAIPSLAFTLLPELPPVGIALVVVLIVISLGVHEAAHGWTALQCGDTTARDLGRISLNPIVHIDPFMTIVLPVITMLTVHFPFGGAKPVPVAFHRLRKPYRDMALVALAGPASNVLLAILFMFVWKVLVQNGVWRGDDLGSGVMQWVIYFNVLLAAFNMVPIPPLDGSRIMAWLLPPGLREPYVALERIGLLLVFGVFFLVPSFQIFLFRSMAVLWEAIAWIVSLGGTW